MYLFPLYTVILLSLSPLSRAGSLPVFQACLPPTIPISVPSTSNFSHLASANFKNNLAIPSAIIQPLNQLQISQAIKCTLRSGHRLCLRSGGHSLSGASLCSGILLDMGSFRHIHVLPKGLVDIGPGATLGETLWTLWHQGRRWFASGVCPGVGLGGYVLGGGHGPYEGKLGMACDSLESVSIVNRFGEPLVASKMNNTGLFWALCGAGGAQFGVVTNFRLKTVSSEIYDNAVMFRFSWPHEKSGELLNEWRKYQEEGGRVWFRIVMFKGDTDPGIHGYGACYEVDGVEECLSLLKKARFFNTPGRITEFIAKVKNALDLHAFFGPEGNYGRTRALDLSKAMLNQRYKARGQANERTYQSSFIRIDEKSGISTIQFWQKYADFCRNPGGNSIPWIVCQLNLFNNRIDVPQNNAFPHRKADVITHFIIGGGTTQDRLAAYFWMKNHLKPLANGVYVSYPELELGKSYPKMYWGSNLERLKRLKRRYDPKSFFFNPQPIPA